MAVNTPNTIITGGPSSDGSETKVTVASGSDITITGTGTTASPYIITSNLSRIGDFVHLAIPTDQLVSSGNTMNFSTQVAQNGIWATQSGTSILLKAGGIYEVEVAALLTGSSTTAFAGYGIYANGVMVGSQAYVVPATHPTANQTGQSLAKAYIVASADTTVNARIINVNVNFTIEGGTINGTNYVNFFTARCIGVI